MEGLDGQNQIVELDEFTVDDRLGAGESGENGVLKSSDRSTCV